MQKPRNSRFICTTPYLTDEIQNLYASVIKGKSSSWAYTILSSKFLLYCLLFCFSFLLSSVSGLIPLHEHLVQSQNTAVFPTTKDPKLEYIFPWATELVKPDFLWICTLANECHESPPPTTINLPLLSPPLPIWDGQEARLQFSLNYVYTGQWADCSLGRVKTKLHISLCGTLIGVLCSRQHFTKHIEIWCL